MKCFIESQCDEISANFLELKGLSGAIADAAVLCSNALAAGGKVMFCGNGGSAADAQHLAAELTGRYEMDRPGMAGLALTTDTSALTAISNDYGYERVFARQVEALGRPGDVLVAISTSGNSPNVVAAAETARKLGVKTVALAGAGGGKLASVCDVVLAVPATRASHVQEMHIAVGHMICGLVERAANG
ncbi:MAG: D-sedoheptulose 7-phosphate isomerase [Lentisphaerae bacterium]|nr:D-sedoheptulose 7-phosphate isomerase [Lentisphaerota bacterium]